MIPGTRAAIQELVRKGLVVDSGERRWSEQLQEGAASSLSAA
jgi:hypothetical protein